MAAKRHVALIVETSSGYGRQILSGVARYHRTHEGWSIFLEQRELTDEAPSWLNNWDGDGILSRSTTRQLVERAADSGIAVVELTDRHADLGLPHVRSNDHEIGRLAAAHLLERGFQDFAFCGFTNERWSSRRCEGFAQAIEAAKFQCVLYESPWHGVRTRPWEKEQQRLVDWLTSLPRPVGVMACNDVRGQHVLDACSRIDLAVPEEVAVIGVDNDTIFCEFCSPPLSSVIPNAKEIGFRAAQLLDELMNDRQPKQRGHFVDPLGIATRQSTEILAINDPDVASAVRFIREHATEGINVADVLKHVPLSRSALERRFRKYLRRSPQQEIRHVQLRRVKHLLSNTDITLDQVAYIAGFEHPEYMNVVFKRETGQTPGQYRRLATR